MADVGELTWVQGMTSEAIRALRPHVTALPATGVKINVNTATPEVMRVLMVNDYNVELVIGNRGEEGYASVDDFFIANAQFAGEPGLTAEPMITVRSEYFEVRSEVDLDRYRTVLYSVIRRPKDTRQASVIQRRRGIS
jgi:general secretion pathway protein K